MDSRAGALTEARDNGVPTADLMMAAPHEREETMHGYTRNDLPATQRAAEVRFGRQNKPGSDASNACSNDFQRNQS
ncbi:MAG: hypothetical protein J0H01_19440 [Rhizobiales bacterium]|nr:hypothetical protein [Hyphomicrobiales bacterium]